MINKSQLSKLTPTELLLLDKHIKLGKEHLEETLSKKEVEQLYQLGSIPQSAEKELNVSTFELIGQSSLAINTILTGAIGGWMGLSAFLQLRLNSLPLFTFILSFSIFCGSLIGYISGKMRKKFSHSSKERRAIQDLEISILEAIHNKRKKELQEKKNNLIAILARLGIHEQIKELENLEHLENLSLLWINRLQKNIKEKYEKNPMSQNFISEIEEIKIMLEKKSETEEVKDIEGSELIQIVQKLSKSSFQPPIITKSWIRKNLLNLITGLMPTIFGGFGSLFVYVGGIPSIAKEMGKESVFQFLLIPEIKIIQFIMVIFITIYFGFSFLYLSRKDYKRDRELSKLDIYITREENQMDLQDDQLLKIKEIFDLMKSFEHTLSFLKKIG